MSERLRRWLRFDPLRLPDVDAAYQEFIRCSKPGVAFAIAVVVAFAAAVGVGVVLMLHGATQLRAMGPILVTFAGLFYGIVLFAVVRSPLPVLGRVLAGAVNVPRVCLLAAGLGALCVVIELTMLVFLARAVHVSNHAGGSNDFFSGGIVAGLILVVVAAPFVEEFLMQGWLQTRLQGLGPFWAAVVTTIVFVLIHIPMSVVDLVRGIGLGAAAWMRATTRSLLACIVVHATNNGLILAVLLAAGTKTHG
jgi:membrane protease YdiL (CAAX protease family)